MAHTNTEKAVAGMIRRRTEGGVEIGDSDWMEEGMGARANITSSPKTKSCYLKLMHYTTSSRGCMDDYNVPDEVT